MKFIKNLVKLDLIMIGDGPLLKECKELVNNLNLNHVITFKGVLK